MTRRRHLLLIAAQSAEMNAAGRELTTLRRVARGLEKVLLDPAIGNFEPGLPGGRALEDGRLTAAELQELVGTAISRAGEQNAILALGFLGHGFIVNKDPTLTFMAWNTTRSSSMSGLNVGLLILEAAQRLPGVLALVDTCHAAGGMPETARLALGQQEGASRVAVLAGSGAYEEGYDMNFSRELSVLLRKGLPSTDRSSFVDVRSAASLLRPLVPAQRVTPMTYGDIDRLYIGANVASTATGPEGPAVSALRAAVVNWNPARPVTRLDARDRRDLVDELGDAPWTPERGHIEFLLDCIKKATRTADFVGGWKTAAVTSTSLGRAFFAVDHGANRLSSDDATSLVGTFERVAITTPITQNNDCRGRLAQFTVELMRFSEHVPEDAATHAWAEDLDALPLVNEALARLRTEEQHKPSRLIVALGTIEIDDWPASIQCWLMRGEERLAWRSFGCDSADAAGAEKALLEAVDWADGHDAETLELPRIEVAAPASVLLDWHPEKCGARWLGVDHTVVLHWIGRLGNARRRVGHVKIMRRQLLTIIQASDKPPLDWLERADVQNRAGFEHRLSGGQLARAIALMWNPVDDRDVFATLLEQTPVLLWPQPGPATSDHKSAIESEWHGLPLGLLAAYRDAWRDTSTRTPLVDMRAVWDDEDYLRFAANFHDLDSVDD